MANGDKSRFIIQLELCKYWYKSIFKYIYLYIRRTSLLATYTSWPCRTTAGDCIEIRLICRAVVYGTVPHVVPEEAVDEAASKFQLQYSYISKYRSNSMCYLVQTASFDKGNLPTI